MKGRWSDGYHQGRQACYEEKTPLRQQQNDSAAFGNGFQAKVRGLRKRIYDTAQQG